VKTSLFLLTSHMRIPSKSLLVLAAISAFLSAVIGLFYDKIPLVASYTTTLLTIAAFLALASSALNMVGTNKSEKDNRKETDALYRNYIDDVKEAFGLMSRRTIDQFLLEKVPADMSLNKTTKLISKALSKWYKEVVIEKVQKWNNEAKLVYDNNEKFYEWSDTHVGCWIFGSYKFAVNFNMEGQNTSTYWDGYSLYTDAPNSHYMLHVIIDDAKQKSERSFFSGFLSDKNRNLLYKYIKWYESTRPHQTNHQSYRHIVIIVSGKYDSENGPDSFMDEFKLWVGDEKGGRINMEPELVIYDMDDIEKQENIFKI
jgi:hypothetical protein